MEYKTYEPSVDLQTLINCFWSLKVPKDYPKQKQQILPDGYIEMCFLFGDDIKRYINEKEHILQPRSFVIGQISKPFFIEPVGEVDSLAVRFNPLSLNYFINEPLHTLSNKETSLRELFDVKSIDRLEQDLGNESETLERIRIIERFLIDTLQRNIEIGELVTSTLDSIYATKGSVGVNKILASNKSQRRQLERKFSALVGVSPKQLCRIIRLQSSLKMMLNDQNKALGTIGHDNEYFDQSHFIKDFKDFTGVSPKEFYKNDSFALSSTIHSLE